MTSRPSSSLSLAEQGFVMPPEWAPHAATWMAWPHNAATWPQNQLAAQHEFIELVSAIADDELVMLLCSGEESLDQFHKVVGSKARTLTNVQIVDVATNDAWARDYAPTFVIKRETFELVGVDWFYNAWGGKYPPFDLDQQASRLICEHIAKSKLPSAPSCRHHSVSYCIEGGAIEINEKGVVLCTKSCALDPNRNRRATEVDVEKLFRDHLGASAVVWLAGDAISGDDTDGHIDQLSRFTPNDTVLYATCRDQSDPQYDLLHVNFQDLKRGFSTLGYGTELVPLPIPSPIQLHGQRLPASYCNFYVTNQKVIVPQFGQASDRDALRIVGEHFPGRDTIGLPSLNLSYGQGSFHCLTQQQPAIEND